MSATVHETTHQSNTYNKRKANKAALKGGIFSYFVDQYDIFLPIITLAPALIYFIPEDLSISAKMIFSGLIFASTLVARPLGAAVFGHYADKVGRHKATLIAIAGIGVTTLGIVLLPGYEQIGYTSIVLMVIFRFFGGFFIGGEYTTAVPLAMEWTPKEKRGLASGSITSMSPIALALTAGLTAILLSIMPSGSLDSAYVQWGWRIPFLISVILATTLFFYFKNNVEESPDFSTPESIQKRSIENSSVPSPLTALINGKYRKDFIQTFILMSGFWLLTNMAVATLPSTLNGIIGLSSTDTSLLMLTIYCFNVVFFLCCAWLSQRFGRRPVYIAFGGCAMLIASTAYSALNFIDPTKTGLILLLCLLINAFSLSGFGPIAAYLTERFPTHLRATGYGVGYSLAIVIPAFYPFYLEFLGMFIPIAHAPSVLIAIGGALIIIGAIMGPETKDTDM